MRLASNGKLKAKSKTFYSKLVSDNAEEINQEGEMRKDIVSILAELKPFIKCVSFTTDLWTSVNGDPFICLTLQLITPDWKLIRFTPYIKPFPQRHTGLNISLSLDQMIEQLGLDGQEFHLFSVNDSAANMVLGIKMSEFLKEYTCDIHKLELVIKDALKKTPGMDKIIKKTKKIGKYANKSSTAHQELKDTCKEFNIKLKKIQNPPNTRWSGYHKNLSSVLYLKTALAQLTSDMDNWGEFQLSVNDWKLVETAVELLKPFKDTIEIWQAEKEPTMHRVIERLYTLNALLTQFLQKNRNNKIGSSFAKALQQSLNTRFPNNGTENALRRIANYIAPQYKGIHLENELELVKSDIKNTFVSDDHPSASQPLDDPAPADDNVTLSPTAKLKLKFKQKKNSSNSQQNTSNESSLSKEFSMYEKFSLAPDSTNLLTWWQTHEKILPILSNVAKIVLTIPCSSAKSERVFSCAGNFATPKRNRLGLKKLEDLVVFNENNEQVKGYKAEHPNLKRVTDRNSFDKIRIEATGIPDDVDEFDTEFLYSNDMDSDTEDEEEDDDDIDIE